MNNFNITNLNINTDYKDGSGIIVATGYATFNNTVDIHISIKDVTKYEAVKESINDQEAKFRSRVIQTAELWGVATSESLEG